MDDEVLSLLRDRFDSIEKRLDQQRGAIEMWGSGLNELTVHVTKQNGRIDKIEGWIKGQKRHAERTEDFVHARLGRWATLLSGLLGGVVVFALSRITGAS